MIYKTFTNGLEVEARFPDDDIQNIYIPLLRRLTRMQEEKNGSATLPVPSAVSVPGLRRAFSDEEFAQRMASLRRG